MDIKCLSHFLFLFACFSAFLVPFHFSVQLSVSQWWSVWGQTNSTDTTDRRQKPKWITLNTEPEKDFIVASTAPDMMPFVLPGHHGFKLSSSSSVHNLLFFILLSSLTLERSPCSLVIFITSFYPLTVVVSRSGQIRGNRRAGWQLFFKRSR